MKSKLTLIKHNLDIDLVRLMLVILIISLPIKSELFIHQTKLVSKFYFINVIFELNKQPTLGDPQWSSGQHRRLGIGRSAVRIPPRQKIFLLSQGPIELCRVPLIQKYTGEMESEGRWKARRRGYQCGAILHTLGIVNIL